ncbi:YheC/YheD family endospore coat-associated protein [Aeribacillus alveayuensis]|uniref:Glutathione synthase/RimK-type ligase-like ATP-grasp enzyme n=1 Tax=Aeribacillus alveayuensis TaxID=279215 RepID=A0ABT9VPR9_9BACI|nr:glutathione synthase/RimK-type ligase-like ATP-grasp enzyme [Bacillus alveayuensis]
MKIMKIILTPHSFLPMNLIEISDFLQRKCHLSLRPRAKFFCGQNHIVGNMTFFRDEKPIIRASVYFFKQLSLPIKPLSLHIQYDRNRNTFFIGPIFTILTDQIYKKEKNVHFGTIHSYCEEMANYCFEKSALLYVTSLSMFSHPSPKGYIYEDGIWKKEILPFPNVIHNRIHSRRLEQSDEYENFLEILSMYDTPIFNFRFLNKWKIHEIFQKNEHLHPYIPKTELLHSKNVLKTYLTDFQHLFVKPIHGSQGRNIIYIKQQDDAYNVQYTTENNDQSLKKYESFQELFAGLYPLLKKQPFIVQEAIPIQTFEGRPLDFRILCHKTEAQKWKVTSIVARVSSKDHFVSNIAKGGELFSIHEILPKLFDPSTRFHIRKFLHEISLEVAKTISQHSKGDYGELGIDMAISKEGKPWILEVNTKPSKNMDTKENDTIRPSAKATIHYCFYLSGYESTTS